MQFIDILNFKKYFKKKGDNALARVGHVNSLVPLVLENSPVILGITPAFIGQIAVDTVSEKVYVAYTATNWTYFETV
jgi:hypothetical protein